MNTKKSTVIKFLACGLLVFLTADLQAQLIKKINFSAAEGYTNGPLYGQPAGADTNVWQNASVNPGNLGTNSDGSVFYCQTVTNGAMRMAPDGNPVSNDTMNFAMTFPHRTNGTITVTYDWQIFTTNVIPADYNPTNNNYNPGTNSLPGPDYPAFYTLRGTDMSFAFVDSANLAPQAVGFPWETSSSQLSTPNRINSVCDPRYNATGYTGIGPQCKDHKKIHMKLVAYIVDQTYDVWAQRDGEQVWHTTVNLDFPDGPFPMRGLPTANGIDCIMLRNNDDLVSTYVLVDNIRIVGPNPVAVPTLSISQTGLVTFGGWLEAADAPQGPYETVAVNSPYQIPFNAAAKKFYRASN